MHLFPSVTYAWLFIKIMNIVNIMYKEAEIFGLNWFFLQFFLPVPTAAFFLSDICDTHYYSFSLVDAEVSPRHWPYGCFVLLDACDKQHSEINKYGIFVPLGSEGAEQFGDGVLSARPCEYKHSALRCTSCLLHSLSSAVCTSVSACVQPCERKQCDRG